MVELFGIQRFFPLSPSSLLSVRFHTHIFHLYIVDTRRSYSDEMIRLEGEKV